MSRRARRSLAIVATAAALVALCAPSASQQPDPSLWYHNGSIVYLVATGNARQFYYQEPRPGMVEAGAHPHSLLFEGISRGGSYVGTAYIFNARCGIYPYRVSGPILDNYERVLLRGQAPLVSANCQIRGYFADTLDFTLLKAGKSVSRKAPDPIPEDGEGNNTVPASSGTGFFITNKGHIVTNNHVVDSCTTVRVALAGSPEAQAEVIAKDKTNDLAVLKSELSPTAVPSLRKAARVGETIYVYGFPLSGVLSTTGNFTTGSITAISGIADDSRIYQISAPVQPGNSGGPVIDRFGNVVGVIVSKLNALMMVSVTRDIPQNINFAIKASILDNFLNSNDVVSISNERSREMPPEAIADIAKLFTVKVLCN